MTCLTEERIQQWADHELDAVAREAAERHLEECQDCRRAADQLIALIEEAEALPRELQPERELWPEIAARLAPSNPMRRLTPVWMQVTAAAAVLALGVWIGTEWRSTSEPSPEPVVDPGYAQLASEVETLRAQVELLVTQRADQFDPETVAAVNETLATLHTAGEEISHALERDPGNRRLRAMRASSVKREAHVLADLMVALNGASMVGIDPTT